jgi:hypothetical protein
MRQLILLGYISIITLILTLIWLILLIAQIAISGPLENYEQLVSWAFLLSSSGGSYSNITSVCGWQVSC